MHFGKTLVVRMVKVNKGIMGQMTKARLALVFLNAISCWLKSNE